MTYGHCIAVIRVERRARHNVTPRRVHQPLLKEPLGAKAFSSSGSPLRRLIALQTIIQFISILFICCSVKILPSFSIPVNQWIRLVQMMVSSSSNVMVQELDESFDCQYLKMRSLATREAQEAMESGVPISEDGPTDFLA
jgi:hypothetical protein